MTLFRLQTSFFIKYVMSSSTLESIVVLREPSPTEHTQLFQTQQSQVPVDGSVSIQDTIEVPSTEYSVLR